MSQNAPNSDDRGQAFTLEGFIAAIVLLTAVLFALQAVVITPTTGGAVDRGVQAQGEQEVKDALLVGQTNGDLSKLVRYYDDDSNEEEAEWYNASDRGGSAYNNTGFANESAFGEILDTHFVEHGGNSFNVEYIYWVDEIGGERATEDIVRMGGARGDGAVSASFTVTLYEDQPLTEPGDDGPEETGVALTDAENYPIPNVADEPVYNVVEVRVTVW